MVLGFASSSYLVGIVHLYLLVQTDVAPGRHVATSLAIHGVSHSLAAFISDSLGCLGWLELGDGIGVEERDLFVNAEGRVSFVLLADLLLYVLGLLEKCLGICLLLRCAGGHSFLHVHG